MKYEKIKSKIDDIISGRNFLRKIFYAGLNIFLLRAWYVKSEVKKFFNSKGENEKVQVLDAGCGFGQYSYFMAKKFKNSKVLGIDINERRFKDCLKIKETAYQILLFSINFMFVLPMNLILRPFKLIFN